MHQQPEAACPGLHELRVRQRLVPHGRNNQAYISTGGSPQGYHDGWGQFAAILLFMEQSAFYNAINIQLGPYQVRNSTACGVGLSPLWCPSDASIIGLRFFEQSAGWDGTTIGITYSSYAGVCGTFTPNIAYTQATLGAMQGMFPDTGYGWYNPTGPVQAPVKIAGVTDGTSNTFLFGEHAKGLMSQVGCSATGGCDYYGLGWWEDSDYGDGTLACFYPPNVANVTNLPQGPCDRNSDPSGLDATSLHPGGVNFAFADGSVHFIKSTINSWNYVTMAPILASNNCLPVLPLGQPMPVYQALSTRNGGEVISSDQY